MAVLDVTRLDPIRGRRPGETGGEWDTIRGLPPRVVRQLRGAGFLGVAGGVGPDDLADQVRAAAGGGLSDCEAIALWIREARRHIEQRRREAARRRERRRAEAAGCRSWWQYRTALAQAAGFSSVHAMAIARGWRGDA